jgi:hypothetical protein
MTSLIALTTWKALELITLSPPDELGPRAQRSNPTFAEDME